MDLAVGRLRWMGRPGPHVSERPGQAHQEGAWPRLPTAGPLAPARWAALSSEADSELLGWSTGSGESRFSPRQCQRRGCPSKKRHIPSAPQWPANNHEQDSPGGTVAWATWRGPTKPVKSAESHPGGSAPSPPRTTRLDTIQSGGNSFGWRLSLSDAKFCSTQ